MKEDVETGKIIILREILENSLSKIVTNSAFSTLDAVDFS